MSNNTVTAFGYGATFDLGYLSLGQLLVSMAENGLVDKEELAINSRKTQHLTVADLLDDANDELVSKGLSITQEFIEGKNTLVVMDLNTLQSQDDRDPDYFAVKVPVYKHNRHLESLVKSLNDWPASKGTDIEPMFLRVSGF